jgi:cold shock CspA family protein
MTDTQSVTPVFDGSRYLGRVKWFNNRAGFGFVTVLEGPNTNEDIFAHHSGINVESEQYKYLVQGEYVEFELRKSDNNDHPYQAGSIKGVKAGMLMCETRATMRKESTSQPKREGWEGGSRGDRDRDRDRDRNRRKARPRGGGPRDGEGSEEGWRMSKPGANSEEQ